MRRFAVLALVLILAAQTAGAQEVAIRQAGAGGRYETQLDPKSAVPGYSAAQVTWFRKEADRLIAQLAAMPQTYAPPPPHCHRLKSWIELNPPHGVLAAEVAVMSPINFNNGRCHRMTGTGLIFRINNLSLLLDAQTAHVRGNKSDEHWWLLPSSRIGPGDIDLGDRIAFTHGRAPLLIPVSTGRYLRNRIDALPIEPAGGAQGELKRWLEGGKARMQAENAAQLADMKAYLKPDDLAKMAKAMNVVVDSTETELRRAAARPAVPGDRGGLEARLAAMTPAQKAAPACLSVESGALLEMAVCDYGLYELNPDYFDRTQPQKIQLIVMETPSDPTHGEPLDRYAARRALWAAIDRSAISSYVRQGAR